MKFIIVIVCLLVILAPSILAGNCFAWQPSEVGLQILREGYGSCDDYAADFAQREAKQIPKFYDCSPNENTSWGPFGYLYPKATMPTQCDEVKWARQRILASIDYLIKKGWNYCHHHDPYWLPPPNTAEKNYRNDQKCNPLGFPDRKMNVDSPVGWQGIDCSHFSMYAYNFAFGSFFNTGIAGQACKTSVLKQLPYTINDIDKFQPGDFLFLGKERITHVVLWTGYKLNDTVNGVKLTLDLLMKNHVPGTEEARVANDAVIKAQKQGKPVYIIADSHMTGPNYRLFAGWHKNAFISLRRLIGADKEKEGYPSNFKFNYVEENKEKIYCYTVANSKKMKLSKTKKSF